MIGPKARSDRMRIGRDEVEVRWPPGIEPERIERLDSDAEAVDPVAEARALAEEIPAAGRGSVLVVVPDRTRAFPIATVLPAFLEALRANGHAVSGLAVAIASGTHRPTEADLDPARLGALPAGVGLVRHDPDGPMVELGRTAAGTAARVHPAVAEASALVALGSTAFHYFAGFGGGPKLLFPGLGARAAIAHNHELSLGPFPPGGLAPGVGPGVLDSNPVARDLREVGSLLPRVHHLTLWARGARAGERDAGWSGARWCALEEFPRVCARYVAGRRIGSPGVADVVVASAGGWPRDLDLVQSHKALFHASRFARPGGTIVLAAECGEGTGSPTLARWLEESTGREDLERRVRARYALNGQTAVSLATIAERFDVRWVGEPGHPELERFGVRHERDLDRAVNGALGRARAALGRTPRVAFVPAATEVVPTSADASADAIDPTGAATRTGLTGPGSGS